MRELTKSSVVTSYAMKKELKAQNSELTTSNVVTSCDIQKSHSFTRVFTTSKCHDLSQCRSLQETYLMSAWHDHRATHDMTI